MAGAYGVDRLIEGREGRSILTGAPWRTRSIRDRPPRLAMRLPQPFSQCTGGVHLPVQVRANLLDASQTRRVLVHRGCIGHETRRLYIPMYPSCAVDDAWRTACGSGMRPVDEHGPYR